MNFPVIVDEFAEDVMRFCGQVDYITTLEQFEVAKTKWVSRFPYSYTFTDKSGKWIKV